MNQRKCNSPLLQNTCWSESRGHQETHSEPRAWCGTGEKISHIGLEHLEEEHRRFGQGDLDASEPVGWKKDSQPLVSRHILQIVISLSSKGLHISTEHQLNSSLAC